MQGLSREAIPSLLAGQSRPAAYAHAGIGTPQRRTGDKGSDDGCERTAVTASRSPDLVALPSNVPQRLPRHFGSRGVQPGRDQRGPAGQGPCCASGRWQTSGLLSCSPGQHGGDSTATAFRSMVARRCGCAALTSNKPGPPAMRSPGPRLVGHVRRGGPDASGRLRGGISQARALSVPASCANRQLTASLRMTPRTSLRSCLRVRPRIAKSGRG